MLSFNEIAILSGEQTNNRKLCKNCGHSILLGRQDKKICTHCGCYVFKDKQTEFKYRMLERQTKRKRENSNEI